ncbi:hypothetical protein [Actinopolyspora mortivallis]|uniref:Uncharacterized protein n=1 Tax=Actinopolyspora mortivallis TaxID=33906 RepID=A0A2T0GWD3_ACTMO|nr:hypothetical protein [Actinopolyspora mortivallis]PRW63407.1 hypothetical protein CEP50_10725 [Actinopolyspora mortivallis]
MYERTDESSTTDLPALLTRYGELAVELEETTSAERAERLRASLAELDTMLDHLNSSTHRLEP